MVATFTEQLLPFPAPMVLASVLLRLEHAQEQIMMKWEPLGSEYPRSTQIEEVRHECMDVIAVT